MSSTVSPRTTASQSNPASLQCRTRMSSLSLPSGLGDDDSDAWTLGTVPVATTPEEVANALQQVLLPQRLPELEGWALATLYQPAGEAVLIGGDFYDWFALPGGAAMFLVGDVSGKGPIAGALGMAVRKVFKGVCWAESELSRVFATLDDALYDEFPEGAFATVTAVRLDRSQGVAQVLSAGHPRPWRFCDGWNEVELPPNVPLGLGATPTWESVEIDLAFGEILLLFSDGLMEARTPDGLFGEGSLSRVLDQVGDARPTDLILRLSRELERYQLNDDLVIAALRVC